VRGISGSGTARAGRSSVTGRSAPGRTSTSMPWWVRRRPRAGALRRRRLYDRGGRPKHRQVGQRMARARQRDERPGQCPGRDGGGPALYAAGSFTTAGGVARTRSRSSGLSGLLGGGMNDNVRPLAVSAIAAEPALCRRLAGVAYDSGDSYPLWGTRAPPAPPVPRSSPC
jgi:hypothetical protein